MKISRYILLALDRQVVFRATIISLIVGTLLVLINHGRSLYLGNFDVVCALQSAATYVVPYMVSTVSSILATTGLEAADANGPDAI